MTIMDLLPNDIVKLHELSHSAITSKKRRDATRKELRPLGQMLMICLAECGVSANIDAKTEYAISMAFVATVSNMIEDYQRELHEKSSS